MKDARFLSTIESEKPVEMNLETLNVWLEENEPIHNKKAAQFDNQIEIWTDLDKLFD